MVVRICDSQRPKAIHVQTKGTRQVRESGGPAVAREPLDPVTGNRRNPARRVHPPDAAVAPVRNIKVSRHVQDNAGRHPQPRQRGRSAVS